MQKVYFYIIVVCFALSACTKNVNLKRQVTVSVMDFTKYSDQGFLITPYEYAADYETLGFVEVEVRPAVVIDKTDKVDESTGIRKSDFSVGPIMLEDAIEQMVERAKDLGADALVSFEYESVVFVVEGRSVEGAVLRALAIKRLGAFK